VLKLYHCPDARSLRCVWALEELRVPYELTTMPFPPRQSAPEYLHVNPLGTVPYLVDGATTMNESAAILEYIATKYGAGSLSVQPDEPAFGAWLNWLHFGETTLTVPLALALRFSAFEPEERRQPELARGFVGAFRERLRTIETALDGQDYLCANRFTVADISVGYALFLSHRTRLLAELPALLTNYLQRLQARPAFAAARKRQKPES
jgi:glutathione S-transferase